MHIVWANCTVFNDKVDKKVKLFCYRPEEALEVPGG
jgi:hypothetical protein